MHRVKTNTNNRSAAFTPLQAKKQQEVREDAARLAFCMLKRRERRAPISSL